MHRINFKFCIYRKKSFKKKLITSGDVSLFVCVFQCNVFHLQHTSVRPKVSEFFSHFAPRIKSSLAYEMEEESDFSDFSQPWEFSDIILEVEDVQFHVHKTILALWSSVFSTMFQSNFKEKKLQCIPLPGKSAEEFRVLLEVIYPNFQRKLKLKSCTFLLEYAREYMMEALTEKCKFLSPSQIQQEHANEGARESCFYCSEDFGPCTRVWILAAGS